MERQRPFGVLLVVVLELVQAALLVAVLLGQSVPLVSGGLYDLDVTETGRAVLLVVGAAIVLAAVGMFLGLRWGWALSMLLVGVGLVVLLLAYANGQFHAIRLALWVAVAFYLNQRAVRDYFEDRPVPVVGPSP
jgi:hypothetical protein